MAARRARPPQDGSSVVMDLDGLDQLIRALRQRGYEVLGPTLRDGAVVHGPVQGVADLPRGVHDVQSPGRYRLEDTGSGEVFGQAACANAWKDVLFPPRLLLWEGTREETGPGFSIDVPDPAAADVALLGIRSCDLAALAIHDRVLAGRAHADPDYAARRARTFVVAVSCARPGGTCFCASTGTGPRPRSGFDLCLTELDDETGHRFVVEVATAAGRRVMSGLTTAPVTPVDARAASAQQAAASAAMGRSLDTEGLRELLYDSVEHPHWNDVAGRCLACGNCTLVCPTCFCTSVQDEGDLSGRTARRWRVWDSCFTEGFSYLHGGSVRASTGSRYRQWATHKLASWQDQFGGLGCVGCGRCITWCPVGIDLTAEVAALRAATQPAARQPADRAGPPGRPPTSSRGEP